MKQCRRCSRRYTDEWKYCLQDGSVLSAVYDSEATVTTPPAGSSNTLPPTIASTYPIGGAKPAFNQPQQQTAKPVFAYVIGAGLALIFIVAGMAVLLNARSGNDVRPSVTPSPSVPASSSPQGFVPTSTPKPAPTRDVVAENKPSLISAIRLADQAEIEAQRTLDPGPLYNSYTGEALKSELAGVTNLKSRGAFRIGRLEDQQFQRFDVSSDEKRATVRVVETWSTIYYSATNGQCISRIPSHSVPQTVYLEHGNNGWIVNSIIYDKVSSEVQALPCTTAAP